MKSVEKCKRVFYAKKPAAPSFTCVCLQASPHQYCGDVRTSQQRVEAVNGASMCNCQLLNFLILICGHIRKKYSHHYCVNIWTNIEKKVLTLDLSSESTLNGFNELLLSMYWSGLSDTQSITFALSWPPESRIDCHWIQGPVWVETLTCRVF